MRDLQPARVPVLVTSPLTSIDAVLAELDRVIADAIRDHSRIGYFAALYRMVTARIKKGIAEGEFQNGERMERFDIIFANRYLKALARYQAGQLPSASWEVAFKASQRWEPTVLQHLLLGMSAHINLDLGIAAATVAGTDIEALKVDFDRINAILASLVKEVEDQLATIWPPLRLFLSTGLDELVIGGGIELARNGAWALAKELAAKPVNEWDDAIRIRDAATTLLALPLVKPGFVGRAVLLAVRVMESDVVTNIRILDEAAQRAAALVPMQPPTPQLAVPAAPHVNDPSSN
ncbi:MAG TPA: DUF5995 family protein [Polyangiales bacterium]